jgi:molybdate transport system substrate-binding protein
VKQRPGLMAFVFAIAAWVATAGPVQAQGKDVLVFAAASLKDALDDAIAPWQREQGKKVVVSYAASSALAQQIEQGAPADLFLPADLDWMDYLEQRNLIKADSRSNLLGNRIVLVAPKDSRLAVDIAPGFDLAKLLGSGRLAIADPASVPAGKYGKAALESLGAWAAVAGKIASPANVRAALTLVSRGEAPLGLVYQTDAAADPAVKVVGTFPPSSHPPIIYPVALIAGAANPDAAAFLTYLKSAAARPFFEKQGFSLLD